MLLEVKIGLTLAAADPADVWVGGHDQALAFQNVNLLALAPFLQDPMRQVDEGVPVRVGRNIDDVTEPFGHLFQRHGGLVRGAPRGFVIEVPEDHNFLLFGRVDALLVLDHVDFGVSG